MGITFLGKWCFVSNKIPLFRCCPLAGWENCENLRISWKSWILAKSTDFAFFHEICRFSKKNLMSSLGSSLWNEKSLSVLLVLSQNPSNLHANQQNPWNVHRNLQIYMQILWFHELKSVIFTFENCRFWWKPQILRILQSWGLGLWLSKVCQTKDQLEMNLFRLNI